MPNFLREHHASARTIITIVVYSVAHGKPSLSREDLGIDYKKSHP